MFIFCFSLLFGSTIAFAGSSQLLSYDGKNIRSKETVNSFELNSETTFTVNHTQTLNSTYVPRESQCKMETKLQRKGFVFYSDTGDTKTVTGTGGFTSTLKKSGDTPSIF